MGKILLISLKFISLQTHWALIDQVCLIVSVFHQEFLLINFAVKRLQMALTLFCSKPTSENYENMV